MKQADKTNDGQWWRCIMVTLCAGVIVGNRVFVRTVHKRNRD